MKFNPYANYSSAYDAWSNGFGAAVTIILDNAAEIPDTLEQALATRPDDISHIDNHELNLWLNVGRHLLHGSWAIAGARQATYMILLTLWDHTQLSKPNTLLDLFHTVENSDPDQLSGMIATEIDGNLDDIITLCYLDATASQLFVDYMTV